ncbi:MAG: dihydroxyacetone kinase transcriptional activator DhaS [Lactobacillus sp.]|nr:dihydroxyacetone kinase transcriptional activator DhaS [Lactobacillus sp.]
MSYLTKQKIATAAKPLITQQGIAKISVTQIMGAAHLRRQTFYENFVDKYDLIAWLYNEEISQIIHANINFQHWAQIISELCRYFDHNRHFYRQVFDNHDQNAPEYSIAAHIQVLTTAIIADLIHQTGIKLTTDYQLFLVTFLSSAVTQEINTWIRTVNPRNATQETDFLQQAVLDMANGLLARYQQ